MATRFSLNTVTRQPDGSLCAAPGGKDGIAMLWDLNEGKRLYSLDAGDIIHCLLLAEPLLVVRRDVLAGRSGT